MRGMECRAQRRTSKNHRVISGLGGAMASSEDRMSIRIAALSTLLLLPAFAAPQESRYKLRNGDTIELSFVYVPEFNQTVTIQPDGFVTLRGVGDVRAGGLSAPELKTAVESKYA